MPLTRSASWCARALVAGTLLAGGAATGAAQERTREPALAWLAGCWELRRGGLVIEEHWLAPRGGELLGMSRTVRGDSVLEHEFLRIHRTADGFVLSAQPSRQPLAVFALAESTEHAVEFRNPAHDFPQRIRYRAAGRDSLIAEIAGPRGGVERRIEFPYGRVPCPAAPVRAP